MRSFVLGSLLMFGVQHSASAAMAVIVTGKQAEPTTAERVTALIQVLLEQLSVWMS